MSRLIARDATGQIVTRITSRRDLVGAIHTARDVLKLKFDAMRVEVYYHGEGSTSKYCGKSLTVVSHEYLLVEP